MSDYSELKRAAEQLILLKHEDCESASQHSKLAALYRVSFSQKATPETVLALIAENEHLQSGARTLERLGYEDKGGELWKPPLGKKPDFDLIDQLKAENEALRRDAESWRALVERANGRWTKEARP